MGLIKTLIKGAFYFWIFSSLGNYYLLKPMLLEKLKREKPEVLEKMRDIETSDPKEIEEQYLKIYGKR